MILAEESISASVIAAAAPIPILLGSSAIAVVVDPDPDGAVVAVGAVLSFDSPPFTLLAVANVSILTTELLPTVTLPVASHFTSLLSVVFASFVAVVLRLSLQFSIKALVRPVISATLTAPAIPIPDAPAPDTDTVINSFACKLVVLSCGKIFLNIFPLIV